jgi:hypothetical protein
MHRSPDDPSSEAPQRPSLMIEVLRRSNWVHVLLLLICIPGVLGTLWFGAGVDRSFGQEARGFGAVFVLALLFALASGIAMLSWKRDAAHPDRADSLSWFFLAIWPSFAIFAELLAVPREGGEWGVVSPLESALPTSAIAFVTLSAPVSFGLSFALRAMRVPAALHRFFFAWGAALTLWVFLRMLVLQLLGGVLTIMGVGLVMLAPSFALILLGVLLLRTLRRWESSGGFAGDLLVGGLGAGAAIFCLQYAFWQSDPDYYVADDGLALLRQSAEAQEDALEAKFAEFVQLVPAETHVRWCRNGALRMQGRTGGLWGRLGTEVRRDFEGLGGRFGSMLVPREMRICERFAERRFGQAWDESSPTTSRLAIASSRLRIEREEAAALARVVWDFEIECSSSASVEWRTELRAGPGSTVSGLRLWIDGEPRKAAFAPRGRAKAAYESVVSRALDPALVERLGDGHYSLRVFPVSRHLPRRVQVTFTSPLWTAGIGREARQHLQLPTLQRSNASWPDETLVEVHGGAPLERPGAVPTGDASFALRPAQRSWEDPLIWSFSETPNAMSSAKEPSGGSSEAAAAPTVFAKSGERWAVQRREPVPTPSVPRAGTWVILLEAMPSFAEFFEEPRLLARLLPKGQRVHVIAHGLTLRSWSGRVDAPELDRFLAEQPGYGGLDPVSGLVRAAQLLEEDPEASLLWLHRARTPDALWKLTEKERPPQARGYVLISGARFQDFAHDCIRSGELEEIPLRRDARKDLAAFFAGQPILTLRRVLSEQDQKPSSGTKVSDQLSRLRAAHEADRLAQAGQLRKAAALAQRFRVVTRATAAVVLEREEQYRQFDLDPDAPASVLPDSNGPIPEPETWILLGMGLVLLIWRKRCAS